MTLVCTNRRYSVVPSIKKPSVFLIAWFILNNFVGICPGGIKAMVGKIAGVLA